MDLSGACRGLPNSATPKYLCATPNILRSGVAYRKFKFGARKYRCGAQEIYAEEVEGLVKVQEK